MERYGQETKENGNLRSDRTGR